MMEPSVGLNLQLSRTEFSPLLNLVAQFYHLQARGLEHRAPDGTAGDPQLPALVKGDSTGRPVHTETETVLMGPDALLSFSSGSRAQSWWERV